MGNVKDEGKKMDPLFPRLHISDADKGGPRTPPRNKMAISQQYNVPSQTAQRSISGSVSPVLPLSPNNGSRLVPSTSSYHDASYKRSMFSSFGRSCGSTRLATRLDSYHSSGINLNISLTTVKQTIDTTNCQTLCNTGHTKRGDYCSYKPQDFATARNNKTIVKKLGDEDDYLVPSFTLNTGSFPTLSTNVYQKQLKLTDKDTTRDNRLNTMTSNDIAREPVLCYADKSWFPEMLNEEVSPSRKGSILIDEQQMLHDPNVRLPLKRKGFQDNMVYKDSTKKLWTLWGDDLKTDRGEHRDFASTTKCEEDHASLQLGDDGKVREDLETDFLSGFNITPGEVSRIIGQEQYCIARRTIIQQQRAFQSQLFELHRLIKVQKILAESPGLLTEDTLYKPNKSPSDHIFPHLDHHKPNTNPEKTYNPSLLDLPPPPPLPPAPTVNCGKQPPWCFLPPPPPGNQWLVPVRSPSEGLVYKPLPGPSPPPVSLLPPVYGHQKSQDWSWNSDFLTGGYNIPTCYQGVGSVLTSYGFPTKYSCSPAIYTESDLQKYSRNSKSTCNYTESDLHGSDERKKGDELPLFPTTPTAVRDSGECTEGKGGFDDGRKVIKAVPCNPKLAPESAARIFQFIQEERKHTE